MSSHRLKGEKQEHPSGVFAISTSVPKWGAKAMQRVGPGQYQVSQGETITVVIKKSVGQWLASVSNLDNATWNPEPDEGIDGSFQTPGTTGQTASFTALYNFTPGGDSSGDFYTVTLTGSNGGANTTYVDAPALQDRTYSFEVTQ